MKQNFDEAILSIQRETQKKNIAKTLLNAWRISPLVLTQQQKKLFLAQIKVAQSQLQQNFNKINLSLKPNNRIWSIHGPISAEQEYRDVQKEMKEMTKLIDALDNKFGTNEIKPILNKMQSLEQRVHALLSIQKQSRFRNFFYSNLPVFMR